jgi:hypothetical protein
MKALGKHRRISRHQKLNFFVNHDIRETVNRVSRLVISRTIFFEDLVDAPTRAVEQLSVPLRGALHLAADRPGAAMTCRPPG